MFIPGCGCCEKKPCVPVMSPCLPPTSIIVKVNATMTGTNASVKNAVLALSFCFNRDADGFYVNADTDGNGSFLLPGTFTIGGQSCTVSVIGKIYIYSTYNCGWQIVNQDGNPPYFEWDYTPPAGDPTYLMDCSAESGGADDAYCVIDADSTTTATGATMVGTVDHTDSFSATIDLSKGSCGGISSTQPFRSSNATWSAIAFDGSWTIAPGSSTTPNFSKASCTIAGYTGNRPTITANRAGVVHITADNVYYDFWWRVFRGVTKVVEYGSDSTPDEGGNTGSITNTFSVSAGDVITLGDPGDYNVLTNLAIWWTAT